MLVFKTPGGERRGEERPLGGRRCRSNKLAVSWDQAFSWAPPPLGGQPAGNQLERVLVGPNPQRSHRGGGGVQPTSQLDSVSTPKGPKKYSKPKIPSYGVKTGQ